jgi:hypothetical protein
MLAIFVFISFAISLGAALLSMYGLYRVAMHKKSVIEKIERLENRFKILIEAINKANYSEYLNDIKQGEDIATLKRAGGGDSVPQPLSK